MDLKTPKSLFHIQAWFGEIIQKPFYEVDKYNLPILDEKTKKQTKIYISPSKSLRSDQRIAIYNQQYWLRLIKILKKDFPFLARLFGDRAFERKILIPYLEDCPPNHWSLYVLGERLSFWIEKKYPEKNDKKLVHHAAILDWAYASVSFEKSFPSLNEICLDKKIYLQPYVKLFEFNADLFSFRDKCLEKEINYWLDHDFPDLKKGKKHYFALFRHKSKIQYFKIEKDQYHLLKAFEKGSCLKEAVEALSKDFPDLDQWFKKYSQLKWLTYHDFQKGSK